jgi:opacity protein-like surface antigen
MSILPNVSARESQLTKNLKKKLSKMPIPSLPMVLVSTIVVIGGAAPARADGFFSPYIGYNFGGDSGCPQITGCQDKRLNAGAALGMLGTVFGFEEDFGYAKDFFGTAPVLDSSVLTIMSNLMIAPKIGPAQPYVLAGVGLMKTHVSFTPSSVFTTDNNNFGWDVGGGLIVFFGNHVGLRGDIRYIHSFQDLKLLGFTVSDTKLNFGRATAGIVLKF